MIEETELQKTDKTKRIVRDILNTPIERKQVATPITNYDVVNKQYSDSGLRVTVTSLTSTNVLGLFGTPVAVIAAPGVGKALVVSQAMIEFTPSTAYTSGGSVYFAYSGTSVIAHSGSIPLSIITSSASSNYVLSMQPNGTIPANTALVLTNASAAFTVGTGTMKSWVWYRTVQL